MLIGNRQALRYIIRNTTLAPRVRAEAQLQLTQMHAYTRPTQIRNRCIMGGKARGVLSDFKLTRVRTPLRECCHERFELWSWYPDSSTLGWRQWLETCRALSEQVGRRSIWVNPIGMMYDMNRQGWCQDWCQDWLDCIMIRLSESFGWTIPP